MALRYWFISFDILIGALYPWKWGHHPVDTSATKYPVTRRQIAEWRIALAHVLENLEARKFPSYLLLHVPTLYIATNIHLPEGWSGTAGGLSQSYFVIPPP
jgi:hypothetical protein